MSLFIILAHWFTFNLILRFKSSVLALSSVSQGLNDSRISPNELVSLHFPNNSIWRTEVSLYFFPLFSHLSYSQDDLELLTLPSPPKCCDYRCVPPCFAMLINLMGSSFFLILCYLCLQNYVYMAYNVLCICFTKCNKPYMYFSSVL